MTIATTSIGVGQGSTVAIISLAGSVPAGSTIVVLVHECANGGSITAPGTIADTAGNTYTCVASQVDLDGYYVEVFVAYNVTALVATNSIVYTANNSGNFSVTSALYATGLLSTSSFDSSATGTATFSTSVVANTSGTPKSNGELFIGCVGWVSDPSTGYNVSNAFLSEPPPTTTQVNALGPSLFVGVAGGVYVNPSFSTLTWSPILTDLTHGSSIIVGLKPQPVLAYAPTRTYKRR